MDDARIKQLTQEVLSQIAARPTPPAPDLESRVAALEATVMQLKANVQAEPQPAPTTVQVFTHPSLQVLNVEGGGERCVIEPDRECTNSGQCRSLGH
jgi:hypothetical protein